MTDPSRLPRRLNIHVRHKRLILQPRKAGVKPPTAVVYLTSLEGLSGFHAADAPSIPPLDER